MLADNVESKRSFLQVNRVMKFTFLTIQVIQLVRSQISYYNLLILSHMGGLLTVPLLIEELPAPALWFRIDIGLLILQFIVNVYLLLVSRQESIERCSWPLWSSVTYPTSQQLTVSPPVQWEMYTCFLTSFLILDCIVVQSLCLSFYNTQGRRIGNAMYDPVMSILLASWLATTLETLVGEVDSMTEPAAESWPIGQIGAMLGLIVVVLEVWEYLKGKSPTNSNIPRHQLWWSQST